jgi:hypothetical protein
MSSILLKPANLPTSVPRNEIRKAMEDAFRRLGFYQNGKATKMHTYKKAAKKAAKK